MASSGIESGGPTAAHVLGLVNVDNQGIAGLEKYIDDQGLADLQEAGRTISEELEAVNFIKDPEIA